MQLDAGLRQGGHRWSNGWWNSLQRGGLSPDDCQTGQFQLLLSSRHYQSIQGCRNRLKNNYFSQAIRLLNNQWQHNLLSFFAHYFAHCTLSMYIAHTYSCIFYASLVCFCILKMYYLCPCYSLYLNLYILFIRCYMLIYVQYLLVEPTRISLYKRVFKTKYKWEHALVAFCS